MAHAVREALRALPSAERIVLEYRYGINGTDGPPSLGKRSLPLDSSDEQMDELEKRGLTRLAAHDELRSLRDAS